MGFLFNYNPFFPFFPRNLAGKLAGSYSCTRVCAGPLVVNTVHADFFHNAKGGGIFTVALGQDAVNFKIGKGKVYECGTCLAGVSPAPIIFVYNPAKSCIRMVAAVTKTGKSLLTR